MSEHGSFLPSVLLKDLLLFDGLVVQAGEWTPVGAPGRDPDATRPFSFELVPKLIIGVGTVHVEVLVEIDAGGSQSFRVTSRAQPRIGSAKDLPDIDLLVATKQSAQVILGHQKEHATQGHHGLANSPRKHGESR